MNFRLLQKIAAAACAIAAIYLLSILVTGGYAVKLAGARFEANKLWPVVVAMFGFHLLRILRMPDALHEVGPQSLLAPL